MTPNDPTPDGDAFDSNAREADAFIPVATPIDGSGFYCSQSSNPLRLENLPRSRAAAHLVFLIATFLLLQITAVLLAQLAGIDLESGEHPLLAMVITFSVGSSVVFVALILMRRSGCSPASIGLSRDRWLSECAWGILVAVASLAAFFLMVGILFAVWPSGTNPFSGNSQRVETMLPDLGPAMLTVMIVLGAAWEEAVFRGILVTHLRRITGGWTVAMALSALLFAGLHTNVQVPVVVIPLFAVAVVWSLFMIWRRSIVASVVGHTLFNLVQLWGMILISGSGSPS
ncbi:MAG: CPBP family intramembrane metalloprotease [Planctomycetes bacterium]|nr:CPBP family intramembrane metalloprotease [Planctomycetota bacterium]